MRSYYSLALPTASTVIASLLLITDVSAQNGAAELRTVDPSGILQTLSTSGPAEDHTNPFFLSLGTNGRACSTCHVPAQAWSISPPEVRRRFEASDGTDPLFRSVDGANSPNADVSTLDARLHAYSM